MAEAQPTDAGRTRQRAFAVDLARAFVGRIVFSLPCSDEEVWHLGFYMSRCASRCSPLTVPPVSDCRTLGFEDPRRKDYVVDAFVAYAVGFLAAAHCCCFSA